MENNEVFLESSLITIEAGAGKDFAFAAAGPDAELLVGGSIDVEAGQGNDRVILGVDLLPGTHEVGGDVMVPAGPGDDQVSEGALMVIYGDLCLEGGPGEDGPLRDYSDRVLGENGAVMGDTQIDGFETSIV